MAPAYAPALSDLRDFRGLLLGYLLMLRDVTEQNRAQAQALEQQRALATQKERERMARELHDSLGQVLSYTSLQVETAAEFASRARAKPRRHACPAWEPWSATAHADLRESILNLHSAAASTIPLLSREQYLEGFTRNYDIRTQLHRGWRSRRGDIPAGNEAASAAHPAGGAVERAQARPGSPGAGHPGNRRWLAAHDRGG